MDFNYLVLLLVLSVGASQGVLIAIGLFNKASKTIYRLSSIFLAILILTVALDCLRFVLVYSGVILDDSFFSFFLVTHSQVFGPLLFLFVTYRIEPAKPFNKYYLLFFLPYLVEIGSFIPIQSAFFRLDGEELETYFNTWKTSDYWIYHDGLMILSASIYLILAVRRLNNKLGLQKVSKWMRSLILLIAGTILYLMILMPVDLFVFDYQLDSLYYRGSTLLQIVLIYLVGYHHWFFKPMEVPRRDLKKYIERRSGEDPFERIRVLKMKIDLFVRSTQIYLDPNLTQATLAEKLEMNPKTLSEVLNKGYEKNFFDFINDYRIEYIKKELLEQAQDGDQTIIDVAKKAGFSSKTTFNRAFRKKTGTTPTSYLKNMASQSR